MTAIQKHIYIFLVSLFLMGCASSKSFVNIEVLEPAKVTYPPSVSNVGFVNRAPFCKDMLSESNKEKLDRNGLYIVDTIVIKNLYKGFNKGRYSEEVSYLENLVLIDLRRKDTIGQAEKMDRELLKNIFSAYDLDALVSLDYYNLSLNKSYPFYSWERNEYIQEYRYHIDIQFRIYLKGNPDPIDKFRFRDTLFYRNFISNPITTYYSATDVLKLGSEEIGYFFGRRQVPTWTEVSRVIYRGGNKELRMAAEHTDTGDWDSAVDLWEGITGSEENKNMAKAYHNLAVFYEIDDDIGNAVIMSDSAMVYWDDTYIKSYNKDLHKRESQRSKLMNQLR